MRCFLKLSFFLLGSFSIAIKGHSQKKIVILGSSTAAGVGASSYNKAWAGLYTNYVASLNSANVVVNLAVPGYTTYHVLPTGTPAVNNRPTVDSLHNITAALAQHPDVIILSLTSNDAASNFSLSESQANFQTIIRAATSSSVPVYITTTAPRNISQSGRDLLVATRDWINNTYGSRVIDFFTTLANPDATINPLYNSGDDTHFNDAAHQIFFNRMKDKNILQTSVVLPLGIIDLKAYQKENGIVVEWNTTSETNVEMYEIEKSIDAQHFAKVATVIAKNLPVNNYKWFDASATAHQNFYRLKAVDKTAINTYSAIVKVNLSKLAEAILVYPNPVQSNSITVQLNNLENGKYTLRLSNEQGEQIYNKTINYTAGLSSHTFKPGNTFVKGIYQLALKGEHTNITKQVVKQ